MDISFIGLLVLYAFAASPYIAAIALIISLVRDALSRKLHRLSIVLALVAAALFLLTKLLSRVI